MNTSLANAFAAVLPHAFSHSGGLKSFSQVYLSIYLFFCLSLSLSLFIYIYTYTSICMKGLKNFTHVCKAFDPDRMYEAPSKPSLLFFFFLLLLLLLLLLSSLLLSLLLLLVVVVVDLTLEALPSSSREGEVTIIYDTLVYYNIAYYTMLYLILYYTVLYYCII